MTLFLPLALCSKFLAPEAQQAIQATFEDAGVSTLVELRPPVDTAGRDNRLTTEDVFEDGPWFALIALAGIILLFCIVGIIVICFTWARCVVLRFRWKIIWLCRGQKLLLIPAMRSNFPSIVGRVCVESGVCSSPPLLTKYKRVFLLAAGVIALIGFCAGIAATWRSRSATPCTWPPNSSQSSWSRPVSSKSTKLR